MITEEKKTENRDVENVINKVNLHIKKTGITLHQFASDVGYTYQTLYRLLNQHFLPSIASLQTIANYFNCSISELTSDNIFIDIPVYEDFKQFTLNIDKNSKLRVYIPYLEFLPVFDKDFFAILSTFDKSEEVIVVNGLDVILNNICGQVFYKIDNMPIDGHYFVEYKYKNQILNVVSVSRSKVIVDFDGDLKSLAADEITPIAYYLNTVFLPHSKVRYLNGEFINA